MSSSHEKLSSGVVYIQTSSSLLGRVLRDCTERDIPNLKDRGCRVIKLGKSVDERVRAAQLRNTAYGGADDWTLHIYKSEECCWEFTAALMREQNFHKFLRGHSKIRHLTRDKFPWLYDQDGASSTEVYFGPPNLVAEYIRKVVNARPEDLKALGEARAAEASAKADADHFGAQVTKLQAAASRTASDIGIVKKQLGDAYAQISTLQEMLATRDEDVARLQAAKTEWRRWAIGVTGAVVILAVCLVATWWCLSTQYDERLSGVQQAYRDYRDRFEADIAGRSHIAGLDAKLVQVIHGSGRSPQEIAEHIAFIGKVVEEADQWNTERAAMKAPWPCVRWFTTDAYPAHGPRAIICEVGVNNIRQ